MIILGEKRKCAPIDTVLLCRTNADLTNRHKQRAWFDSHQESESGKNNLNYTKVAFLLLSYRPHMGIIGW